MYCNYDKCYIIETEPQNTSYTCRFVYLPVHNISVNALMSCVNNHIVHIL